MSRRIASANYSPTIRELNRGRNQRKRRKAEKKKHLLVAVMAVIILVICCLAVWIMCQDISANIAKNLAAAPSGNPQSAQAPPTATPVQTVAAANGPDSSFLPVSILVNFEHPLPSLDKPYGLVPLDKVFHGEVSYDNGQASIDPRAGTAASEMFRAALKDGISPYVISSAYRSTAYQNTLFQSHLKENPAYGADPYIHPVKVMPGENSEHCTGLALDILNVNCRAADDSYGDTPEGRWLAEHSYEYGFILRYPKNKEYITGVIYEPWHYRYVGKDIAQIVHDKDLCFEEYCEQK